jgi:hypothetical protein
MLTLLERTMPTNWCVLNVTEGEIAKPFWKSGQGIQITLKRIGHSFANAGSGRRNANGRVFVWITEPGHKPEPPLDKELLAQTTPAIEIGVWRQCPVLIVGGPDPDWQICHADIELAVRKTQDQGNGDPMCTTAAIAHPLRVEQVRGLLAVLGESMPTNWFFSTVMEGAVTPAYWEKGRGIEITLRTKGSDPIDWARGHGGRSVVCIMESDYKSLSPNGNEACFASSPAREFGTWRQYRVLVWGSPSEYWGTCHTDIEKALKATESTSEGEKAQPTSAGDPSPRATRHSEPPEK